MLRVDQVIRNVTNYDKHNMKCTPSFMVIRQISNVRRVSTYWRNGRSLRWNSDRVWSIVQNILYNTIYEVHISHIFKLEFYL